MNRGLKKTMGIWFTLILGGLVIFSGFGPVQPAVAATIGDIVTQTDQGLGAKQDLQTIVKNAVTEGMASNLGLAELCAAIGETVMNAGYQADPSGVYAQAGQTICAMLQALTEAGLEQTDIFRALSMAISGMRAAAARNQMDPNLLQTSIENALSTCAPENQQELLQRMVASAFAAPVAATYTPGRQQRGPNPSPPRHRGDVTPPSYSGELPT